MNYELRIKLFCLLLAASLAQPAPAQVDTVWERANGLYAEGKYAESAALYVELEKEGRSSAALYFNAGNAFYKQGEMAKAILYYERALVLAPADEDTRYNLELANLQIVDKIEPVPQFFLVSWIEGLYAALSFDAWAKVGLLLFAAVLGLLLLVFFSGSVRRKKLAFAAAIVLLCLSLCSTYIAVHEKRRFEQHAEAIIFVPVTPVKGSPDSTGVDLFVLHEGTKVTVLEAIGGWKKVKTADGNQGWLPASAIESI
jgi:tetratricopeptide (TPR) repeat protein